MAKEQGYSTKVDFLGYFDVWAFFLKVYPFFDANETNCCSSELLKKLGKFLKNLKKRKKQHFLIMLKSYTIKAKNCFYFQFFEVNFCTITNFAEPNDTNFVPKDMCCTISFCDRNRKTIPKNIPTSVEPPRF